jgi:hypothetical protein
MGVFLDRRIYLALALLSLLAVIGFGRLAWRLWHSRSTTTATDRLAGLGILALSLGVTTALYLAYNLTFVQHQGRYLFPALIPIAVFFTSGLGEWPGWLGPHAGLDARWQSVVRTIVLYGFAFALAMLAVVSLERFIVPGLT